MRKNDIFFKVLFAIEVALVPMVFFANLLMDKWAICMFVGAILLAKIWLELFKDRMSRSHIIIDGVGSIVVFSALIILFIVKDCLPLALGVASLVLIVVYNVMNMFLYKKTMTEFIEAVDYCYILFEILALISFTFIVYYDLIAYIALIAVILTTVVSVCYKIYFIFKYTKANKIFDRFRRRRRTK